MNDRRPRYGRAARPRIPLLVLLVVGLLPACGGRGPQGGTAPQPTGTALTVELSEFKIAPRTLTAKPGSISLTIKNVGTVEHNFVVVGTEVKLEAIQPGETKTVRADLPGGTYRVICTIPGHEEAGMVGSLKVGP